MFAYVDPRYQVRTVEYVADAQGFHPVLSNPVADTPTVAAAKAKHADLYARIAAEHARIAAERGPERDDQAQQLNYWWDLRKAREGVSIFREFVYIICLTPAHKVERGNFLILTEE